LWAVKCACRRPAGGGCNLAASKQCLFCWQSDFQPRVVTGSLRGAVGRVERSGGPGSSTAAPEGVEVVCGGGWASSQQYEPCTHQQHSNGRNGLINIRYPSATPYTAWFLKVCSASLLCCCAVLCCAVLCCAVLCCAVLCCAVLCCAQPPPVLSQPSVVASPAALAALAGKRGGSHIFWGGGG